jgi:hypothetical protein
LAAEFYDELKKYGHIYMYRFRPTEYEMKAYSIDDYPAKCKQAAAIMLMIQNNLDKRVNKICQKIDQNRLHNILMNWLLMVEMEVFSTIGHNTC